jgi:hypothetical protein
MDRKPCPNRTKRPKYSRSDFKIFSDEKRWELINIKLMAYDDYCQKQMTEKPTHELLHISLPQLSAEIHQMWSLMSTEDRNKYRPRAILDIKRRRVAKKDDRWDRTSEKASMDTVPSQSQENKNLPPLPAMSMEHNIDSTPLFHSDPSDNDASSSLSWSKLDPTLLSDPMGLWLEQDDVAVPDRLMPGTKDLIFVDGTTMISESIDDMTSLIGTQADPIPVDPDTCKTQKQPSQSSSSSLHAPYDTRSRMEDGDSGVTSSSLHWNPPVEEQMTMLDINPSISMLHSQNSYAISSYERPILSTYHDAPPPPPPSASLVARTNGSNLPGYGHASPWNIGYPNLPIVYNYPVYPQFYHQVQSFHDASISGYGQPNPFSPHCTLHPFIRYPPYYPQSYDPAPVTTQHPIRNQSREINDSSKVSSVPTSN